VEAGFLKREEAAPRNPWEICRADLNIEAVRSIIQQLYVAKRRAYQDSRTAIRFRRSRDTGEPPRLTFASVEFQKAAEAVPSWFIVLLT
jgi:hypothetical protein